jgi:hypothetical protein
MSFTVLHVSTSQIKNNTLKQETVHSFMAYYILLHDMDKEIRTCVIINFYFQTSEFCWLSSKWLYLPTVASSGSQLLLPSRIPDIYCSMTICSSIMLPYTLIYINCSATDMSYDRQQVHLVLVVFQTSSSSYIL